MRRLFGHAENPNLQIQPDSLPQPIPFLPQRNLSQPQPVLAPDLSPDLSPDLGHGFGPRQLPFASSSRSRPSLVAFSAPARSASHPAATATSLSGNLRFDMMLQLLASQALIEASAFQMLPFDRVDRLKKDQIRLQASLDALNQKIDLESKIQVASTFITDTPQDLTQLTQSNAALNQLRDQRDGIQSRLFDLRVRLLQHFLAALSLGLSKSGQQLASAGVGPDRQSESNGCHRLKCDSPKHCSPSPAPTGISARSAAATLEKFDGPHLFANHRYPPLEPPLPTQPHTTSSHSAPQSSLKPAQLEALNEEIQSLKKVVRSKDSKIAEQSTDISLLQLELDTLRRSRSESSDSRQVAADRTQNGAVEHTSAQAKSGALALEIERMKREEAVTRQELDTLRVEADILRADLERERASGSGRGVQGGSRPGETPRAESSLEIERLRAELQSAQKLQAEVSDLRARCQEFETQRRDLDSQLALLQSHLADQRSTHQGQPTDLEAGNVQQWTLLLSGLTNLGHKLIQDDTAFGTFLSTLSDTRAASSSSRARLVEEIVEKLDQHLTSTAARLAALRSQAQEDRISHEREESRLEARIAELDARLSQRAQAGDRSDELQEIERLQGEVVALKKKLEDSDQVLRDLKPAEKAMRELYKSLPAHLENREHVDAESELGSIKQAYEQPKRGIAASGLGGLFGLSKRTPTPTTDEAVEYSVEAMVERVKMLVDWDRKLVDRLVKYESEKDSHKANALRAQKLVEESQEALRTYQTQVNELQERLVYSDSQSAAMLEKFNDLMESEDKANAVARKAEASIQPLQNQVKNLTTELENYKKLNRELEKKLDEMKGESPKADCDALEKQLKQSREEIEDLIEELKVVKERETKARNQLFNELSESQSENSGLRVKIRQLERAERARE